MSIKLGYNAKLYMLDGTRASWGALATSGSIYGRYYGDIPEDELILISNLKDVEVPAEFEKFDSTTRGSGGIKTVLPTLLDVSIDLPMLYDVSSNGFTELFTAALDRTSIPLLVADGPVDAPPVKGFWADFAVTVAKHSQKLADAQELMFNITPSGLATVAPQFIYIPSWPVTITLVCPQNGTTVGSDTTISLTWTSSTGFTYGEVFVNVDGAGAESLGFFDGAASFIPDDDFSDTTGVAVFTVTINSVNSNTRTVTTT